MGLQCCPLGFEAHGATACGIGAEGKWPVVQCGEADAEENELRTYDAAAGSAGAKPTVTALMLRYRSGDVEPGASETGNVGSASGGGGHGGGMSTGAVAAVATVIPLAVIVAAIVAWIVWRRKRRRSHLAPLNTSSEKGESSSDSMDDVANAGFKGTAATYMVDSSPFQYPHETPEWNAEMDATDTERKQLVTSSSRGAEAAVGVEATREAAELGV